MRVRENTRMLLYAIAFGALIVAVLIAAAIITMPKAHADPVDDYGPIVCARFDAAEAITPNVIRSVGRYLTGQGFSEHEAAGIVWDSVQTWCPRYELAVSAIARLAQQGVVR